jgi:hypothetical protein
VVGEGGRCFGESPSALAWFSHSLALYPPSRSPSSRDNVETLNDIESEPSIPRPALDSRDPIR